MKLTDIFHLINYTRIHVIALYGFLLWFLMSQRLLSSLSISQYFIVLALTFILGFVYIHNKTTDVLEDKEEINLVSIKYLKITSAFFLFFGCVFSLSVSGMFFIVCFMFAIVGYLYNKGIFVGKNKILPRLKSLFVWKTIVAGGAWYLSVITAFYFSSTLTASFIYLAYFYLYLFFLFIAFELWWDIRDIKGDTVAKVKTIPVVFGVQYAYIVSFVSLAISYWLRVIHGFSFISVVTYLMLIISMFMSIKYKTAYHLAIYGFILLILFQFIFL